MPDNRLPTNQSIIDLKDSIDLLTANINRTASNIPYDSNLTIKAAIDGKVSKTGDTITGILQIQRSQNTGHLLLGNNTNSEGLITMYTNNQKYAQIKPPTSPTVNPTITLPDKNGTIALTSDLEGATVGITSATASGVTRAIDIVNQSKKIGKLVIINVTFTSNYTASNSPGMLLINNSSIPAINSALSCCKLASNGDIEAVVGAYSLTNGTIYVKEVTNGSKYVLTGNYTID